MTVHIALANGRDGLLLSDSQGTLGLTSEIHGWHKQFVADDCLIGVAGHGGILEALYAGLRNHVPTAANVHQCIVDFLESEVRPPHRASVNVLVLADDGTRTSIRSYDPGLFYAFGEEVGSSSIGSGSEFVNRARKLNVRNGIHVPTRDLAEMLVHALDLAELADESLTVDNVLSAAFLHQGRSYAMADESVSASNVDSRLVPHWSTATYHWGTIAALARTIAAEVRSAARRFSAVWQANVSRDDLRAIESANVSVGLQYKRLRSELNAYRMWYDGVLGR